MRAEDDRVQNWVDKHVRAMYSSCALSMQLWHTTHKVIEQGLAIASRVLGCVAKPTFRTSELCQVVRRSQKSMSNARKRGAPTRTAM